MRIDQTLLAEQIYLVNTVICTMISLTMLIKALTTENAAEFYNHFRKCLLWTTVTNVLEVFYALFRLTDVRILPINYLVAALYDISACYLCYRYFRFFRRAIRYDSPKTGRLKSTLGRIPFWILLTLVIMSARFDIIIRVDRTTGLVSHGRYYWLFMLLSYGYVLYGFADNYIRHCHRRGKGGTSKRWMRDILAVGVPCVLGCLAQVALFQDLPYAAISVTLAMLIVYSNLTDSTIMHDALSKLPNKANAMERITRKMRGDDPFYLVMLDVNDFKAINDTFGHAEGDKVIVGIGRALREACVGIHATAARFGGDEFCLIAEEEPTALVENVRQKVAQISVGSGQRVSVSAGVCRYDGTVHSAAALIETADARMYEEKKRIKAAMQRG